MPSEAWLAIGGTAIGLCGVVMTAIIKAPWRRNGNGKSEILRLHQRIEKETHEADGKYVTKDVCHAHNKHVEDALKRIENEIKAMRAEMRA